MRYELLQRIPGGAVLIHASGPDRVSLETQPGNASVNVLYLSPAEADRVADALRAAAAEARDAARWPPGGQTRPGPVDRAQEGR